MTGENDDDMTDDERRTDTHASRDVNDFMVAFTCCCRGMKRPAKEPIGGVTDMLMLISSD